MSLYGITTKQILAYFRTVLDDLKHHHATLKLKICKWFQDRCEFLGVDFTVGGTQPVHSKNEAFAKLEKPNTWGDLCMLISLFGLYRKFLNLYEMGIRTCSYILSKYPQPGKLSRKKEMELMQNLWTLDDQILLEIIMEEIMEGPTLVRPYPS